MGDFNKKTRQKCQALTVKWGYPVGMKAGDQLGRLAGILYEGLNVRTEGKGRVKDARNSRMTPPSV